MKYVGEQRPIGSNTQFVVALAILVALVLSAINVASAAAASPPVQPTEGRLSAGELLADDSLELIYSAGAAEVMQAAKGDVSSASVVDPAALEAVEFFHRVCRSCRISELYVEVWFSYYCGCNVAYVSWSDRTTDWTTTRGAKSVSIPRGDYYFSAYMKPSRMDWGWFYGNTLRRSASMRVHAIALSWYML